MIATLSQNVYSFAKIVFWPSLFLAIFASGVAPFGLSVAWSEEGFGSSLVFARYESSASMGEVVLATFGSEAPATLYTVQTVVRKAGSTYYQVFPNEGNIANVSLIRAGEYGRVVVGTVPVLGTWVHAVSRPIGLMTLLGLPALMFFINGVLVALRKIFSLVSSVERTGANGAEKRERRVASTQHKNEKSQNDFEQVFRPFGRGYGM